MSDSAPQRDSQALGPEYEYDLDFWSQRIPLKEDYSDSHLIAGPLRPLLRRRWRKDVPIPASLPPSVPGDVFVFAEGEPARRDVTKINGLPYRPRGLPWPMGPEGPLTFLGQIRFTESRDVVGETPGDLLLLFVDNFTCFTMHTEWYPLGLTDLIQREEVPAPEWTFFTGYGLRERVKEYRAWPDCPENFARWHMGPLSISSACDFIPPNPENLTFQDLRASIWLCSLYAASDSPYPWANHPSPLTRAETRMKHNKLNFMDTYPLWLGITHDFQVHSVVFIE